MNLDAYLTRDQAARYLRVAPGTIGKWHDRGWVNPTGDRCRLRTQPGTGRTIRYRLGDLLQAERDTAQSGKGHRHTPAVA